MIQQFTAPTALAEDLRLIPSAHMAAYNRQVTPLPGELTPL